MKMRQKVKSLKKQHKITLGILSLRQQSTPTKTMNKIEAMQKPP